jgi:hypothetical protein
VLRDVGFVRASSSPKSAAWALEFPHLLPVDDPLLTVRLGTGTEPGQVGAGGRLAEQLAPAVRAARDPWQEPVQEVLPSMFQERRGGEVWRRCRRGDR